MRRKHPLKLFLLLLILCFQGHAQVAELKISDGSTMTITGTSTLQGWTSDVTVINGTVRLDEKVYKKGSFKKGDKIEAVSLSVPVQSIKSPRGATMEQKIYNALRSETNPQIKFTLTDNQVTTVAKDSFLLETRGNLEIAGKIKPVTVVVTGKKQSDEGFSFEGTHKINMKDFEVEPPTAMFGQIVTGEEVEISFKLIAKK